MSAENQQVIVATGGYDRMVRFWDAAQCRVIRGVDLANKCVVQGLCLSPDTHIMAVLTQNIIRFMQSRGTNTAYKCTLEGHHEVITAGGFLPSDGDTQLFWSVSEDKTARIWSLVDSSNLMTLRHISPVLCGAVHPAGRVLLTGDSAGCLRAWDLRNGKTITEMQLFEQDVSIKALACGVPAGEDRALVVVGNRSGRLWVYREDPTNPQYLTLISEVQAHSAYVLHVLFSRDGRLLASCGADHVCRLWSVNQGGKLTLVKTLGGHTGWVWSACFADDSAFVMTASSDGTAKLWKTCHEDNPQAVRTYAGPNRGVTAVALHDGSPAGARGGVPLPVLPTTYLASIGNEQ